MKDQINEDQLLEGLADTLVGVDTYDLRDESPISTKDSPHEGANRYWEIREVGRGGLGVVVEALDQTLRRRIAIKRVHQHLGSEFSLSLLKREAQITAQLEHPNILTVHDLGLDESKLPYFTMTLLDGAPLSKILRESHSDRADQKPPLLNRSLRLFLQIAYAVAYAHNRGVVHRDLKPENIIVGKYGDVRLIDWGIARILDHPDSDDLLEQTRLTKKVSSSIESNTAHGVFMGTLGYASPEQVDCRQDLDERSDVFSLGALLYQMIAGQPAIKGNTTMELVMHTLSGSIVPIQEVTNLDPRLAAIVKKALETDRELRYQTALEMIDDVEAMLDERSVSALDESLLNRAHRFYTGRRSLRKLTLMQLDLMCGGSMTVGVAIGLFWESGIGFAVIFLALLGVALSIPGMRAILCHESPTDKSRVRTREAARTEKTP